MYTSRQGILWQGEWRHRTENGQYYIKGAGIDQDAADLPSAIANRDQYDGWRGSIETKGLFNLGSWWKFGWDITLESDDTFRRFYKLDNMLLTDRVNKVFLAGHLGPQLLRLAAYQFGGLMYSRTRRDRSRTRIRSSTTTTSSPIRSSAASCTWNTNALSFTNNQDPTRSAPFADGNEQMNRVVTELNWRRRFTDPIGITYTPFAQLRGDLYQISDYVDPQSTRRAARRHLARARPGAGRRDRRLSVGRQHAPAARTSSSRSARSSPARRPSSRTTCRTRTPRASCSTTPTCSS